MDLTSHSSHPPQSLVRTCSGRWHSGLLRIYTSLTRDDAVQSADLIFVMAGQMERKQYGLELYRSGASPKLVLSVGRFEVSRFAKFDVECVDELIALRDQTPPDERHFFVKLDASGVRIEKAALPRWNTYGEVVGLRRLLEKEKVGRVIVISTDVHLRRVALTIAKVFRGMPVQFLYCPVPSRLTRFSKEDWWSRPNYRRFVVREMIKLTGYRMILFMPRWVISWIMRFK
jgi:uncharacterized SAM-binding protein YcdF (DUF218 family)